MRNVTGTAPPVDGTNELLVQALQELARGADAGSENDVAAAAWKKVLTIQDSKELPAVVQLGWRLYFDGRLSGDGANPKDILGNPTPSPRQFGGDGGMAPMPLNISCATCHDPQRYGADFTSQPRNVSSGAGYYDVNGQQTLNVARLAPVFYWNGRADSLWSQAAQVMESGVSMNGHRARTLWLVSQCYLNDPNDSSDPNDPQKGAPLDDQMSKGAIAAAAKLVAPASPTTATTEEFKAAFANHSEVADTAKRVHTAVAKAIAAYEWFLNSDGSRFDQFAAASPTSGLLTPPEKRGLKLFIGRAGCVNCHSGNVFSDLKFHNVGVAQSGPHVPTVGECNTTACSCPPPAPTVRDGGAADGSGADAPGDDAADADPPVGATCLPAGAYAGVQKLHADNKTNMMPPTVFRRCDDQRYGCFDDADAPNRYYEDSDAGAPPLPHKRWLGAWRTPSLRDVAMTGPYMHDGSIATLEDVVWHYDQGASGETMGKSELAPLFLTAQDRADLVAFLGTLTGQPGPPLLLAKPSPTAYPPLCDGHGGPIAPPDAGVDEP